jgi:hypothetical protein
MLAMGGCRQQFPGHWAAFFWPAVSVTVGDGVAFDTAHDRRPKSVGKKILRGVCFYSERFTGPMMAR